MRAVANGESSRPIASSSSSSTIQMSSSKGSSGSSSMSRGSSSSSGSQGSSSSASARQGSSGGGSRPESLGRNILMGELEPKGKGVVRDNRSVVEIASEPKASSSRSAAAEPTRGRAPEFPGGTVTESEFLNHAEQYLGSGYRSLPNGRYLSQDGLRQVRYGRREVTSARHHGHFEAYNRAGGNIIENTVVEILPD